MNIAVPTKQVQTGGHYEDASSSNSDTCSLQACTSSSTHNTSGTKTGTISCTIDTTSATGTATETFNPTGPMNGSNETISVSCPGYYSGGSASGSASGGTISGVSLTDAGTTSSVSYHLTVTESSGSKLASGRTGTYAQVGPTGEERYIATFTLMVSGRVTGVSDGGGLYSASYSGSTISGRIYGTQPNQTVKASIGYTYVPSTVTVTIRVSYTKSNGYSGSSGGSWSPTPYYIDSIGPVTTNSGSGSISQYGTSGYIVAVSGASSSRVSYSFPYGGYYITSSTSYKGSGSIRVPSSYDITSVSSNKGSVSYSRSGDYVNYNVTSSSSGSARVTAYYTYQYYVPTYSTYADVKFTGHYANGASAVNVNANSINFNGEIYA